MRDDRARLIDMMEAITSIERYTVLGKVRFFEDELVRTFIVHQLQILGEAACKLSSDLWANHAEVPWPKVLGMRHVLVHDYFRVSYDIVWDVVEFDLPALKAQIKAILDEHGPKEGWFSTPDKASRQSAQRSPALSRTDFGLLAASQRNPDGTIPRESAWELHRPPTTVLPPHYLRLEFPPGV
jgi:uncharacterized protein with HEPN domain